MTRRAVLPAVLVLLALPGRAAAATTTITMPGKYFDPPRSTAVAGDLVLFKNNDLATHDVRLAGGVFDSGPIARFRMWSQPIDQPGAYPFICTLHPFMSGNLDVVAATLTATPDGVIAGEPLTLTGRAAAGTVHVAVEQSVAGGAWTPVGAGAMPAADGSFSAEVPAVEGASYRAVTPRGAGQVVTPRVTARVDVHVEVERSRRHTTVHVHTMPAAPGFTAKLQLYSRWHYRWRTKRRAALDPHGGARFRVRGAPRTYARVVLSRTARGSALVQSSVLKLWSGKVAPDPDGIMPPSAGHHH